MTINTHNRALAQRYAPGFLDFPASLELLLNAARAEGPIHAGPGDSTGPVLLDAARVEGPVPASAKSTRVACSRCGNPDSQMCDCSLPGPVATPPADEVGRAVERLTADIAPGSFGRGHTGHEADLRLILSHVSRLESLLVSQSASPPLHQTKLAEDWRPMATVPKYAGPVLLKFKDTLPRADLDSWRERIIVAKFQGGHSDWCIAAPVGRGGFPDDWFSGWAPLPGQAHGLAHGERSEVRSGLKERLAPPSDVEASRQSGGEG